MGTEVARCASQSVHERAGTSSKQPAATAALRPAPWVATVATVDRCHTRAPSCPDSSTSFPRTLRPPTTGTNVDPRDTALRAHQRRQHGLFTLRQALDAGFTRPAIRRALVAGRTGRSRHPGVLRRGRRALDDRSPSARPHPRHRRCRLGSHCRRALRATCRSHVTFTSRSREPRTGGVGGPTSIAPRQLPTSTSPRSAGSQSRRRPHADRPRRDPPGRALRADPRHRDLRRHRAHGPPRGARSGAPTSSPAGMRRRTPPAGRAPIPTSCVSAACSRPVPCGLARSSASRTPREPPCTRRRRRPGARSCWPDVQGCRRGRRVRAARRDPAAPSTTTETSGNDLLDEELGRVPPHRDGTQARDPSAAFAAGRGERISGAGRTGPRNARP